MPPPEAAQASIAQLILSLAAPPEAQVRAFIAEGRALTLEKGAFLSAPGATEHRLGFLHTGLLRYHVVTGEGLDMTKDFALPGLFVASYGSALRGAPVEVAISAVERSELTVWPFSRARRRRAPPEVHRPGPPDTPSGR